MNKRGLGPAAIIFLILGASILLVSSSVIGKEGGLFKTLNSPYTVDSIVAKCNSECATIDKDAYCYGPKTLKSDTETLKDITCYYLVKNKPEYGLEQCEKLDCEDEASLLRDDPQTQTSPKEDEVLDLTPGEELDCKQKIEKLIQTYTAAGNTAIPSNYRSIAINPTLFKALLLQENRNAFDKDCPYAQVGEDGKSLGLMQITSKTACNGKGAYGLPLDIKLCEEELKTNIETSIRVGSIIFRERYSWFKDNPNSLPKDFSPLKCLNSDKTESLWEGKNWKAAIRGYNGWYQGRSCEFINTYPNEVLARCQSLAGKPCLNDKGEVII